MRGRRKLGRGGWGADREYQGGEGPLLLVSGDVGEESQVLDQATGLPLRGVTGADHPPLGALQGPGPTHLAGLLKLGGDARHVAHCRYEGQPGQYLQQGG